LNGGRPAWFTGKGDERTNESGTDTGIGHRTETTLHWRAPVPGVTSVAPAARSRRALDHVGGRARCDRYRPRGTSRWEKGLAEVRFIVVDVDSAADTRSFADTYGMTLAYDEGRTMLHHDAMPNRSSHRPSHVCPSNEQLRPLTLRRYRPCAARFHY